jgi:crossover junction endodeoxyribonuclease RuvC
LFEIFTGVTMLIDEHAPQEVAVEQVFLARNVSSALKLGQALGAALAAAAGRGLPVSEYAARRVKQAVTGTGARAQQMQHMVRVLLDLSRAPTSDAATRLPLPSATSYSGPAGTEPQRAMKA